MAQLTTQTNKYTVVLSDKNKTISKEALKEYFNANALQYAFIKHDKDTNENGEVKTLHYHVVVLNSIKKRQRLSTILTNIADTLGISTLSISIEPLKNDIGALQYLIHKNDLDKFQYEKADIITNIDLKELDTYLEADNDNLTIDRIVYLCKISDTIIDVIKGVGFGRYHLYRNTILDIWKQFNK